MYRENVDLHVRVRERDRDEYFSQRARVTGRRFRVTSRPRALVCRRTVVAEGHRTVGSVITRVKASHKRASEFNV